MRPEHGLIGQDGPLAAALGALRRGRVAHAQIIVAPQGAGKGRFAEILAAAQVCADPRPDGVPCGACPACALVRHGAHADLHWIGQEGRLGIDEIRELSRAAVLAPQSAPCSIFVVEACERLTGPAAAALLKTLEDPAGPVLFLLLAEHPDRLEPTLRSRCLPVRLRPVPPESVAMWLAVERPEVSEAMRAAAAQACAGNPGTALRLLDNPPDGTALDRLCAGLLAVSPAQVVDAAADVAPGGLSAESVMAALRDAWVARYGLADQVTMASTISPSRLADLAAAYGPKLLTIAASATLEARAAEEANVNTSLNWQVLFNRLRRARSAC